MGNIRDLLSIKMKFVKIKYQNFIFQKYLLRFESFSPEVCNTSRNLVCFWSRLVMPIRFSFDDDLHTWKTILHTPHNQPYMMYSVSGFYRIVLKHFWFHTVQKLLVLHKHHESNVNSNWKFVSRIFVSKFTARKRKKLSIP